MQRLKIWAHFSAAVVIVFAGMAAAQTADPATQPADPPSTQPTTEPTTWPTTNKSTFTLNFKDVSLDSVLDYFSQTIGFEILRDGPVDAHVSLLSRQPVTADEAVDMLSAALKANGFIAVREGRILHIGSRDKLKKSNVPVHFGAIAADIPETDELITQVIPLDNLNAVKLLTDLKPLLPDGADVSANEGSNSILITDTSANVHRLVVIISQLDQHEATTSELRIIQLKHASAASTAKLIDTLFKTAPAIPQNPNQPQMMGPRGPQQGGAPPGESERHGQTVVVTADERTNSILVLASAPTLRLVDMVVAKLDTGQDQTPGPQPELKLFTLTYAASDATAKLINDTFKGGAGSNPLIRLLYGDVGGGEDEDKTNQVSAQSDDRTNTVIVTASPEKMKLVESLILQLDKSPMVSQEIRVIRLKHADAYNVAKLVTDIFIPKQENGQSQGRFGLIILSLAPQEGQPKGVQINISSDERTNTLVVSAPHAVLDAIEKTVHELDADPSSEDEFFIYHLRNSQATRIAQTLNVVFGNAGGGGPQQPAGQQYNPIGPQNPFGQNGQNGGGGGGNQNRGGNNNGGNNNNNGNNQNRNGNNPNGQQRATASAPKLPNDLTGNAFFVADPDTNSLLVTCASKYRKQVEEMIDDLDRPVRQVMIRVLLAEVTHDTGDQFGVDFSILNDRQTSNNLVLGTETISTSPAQSITSGGVTSTTGGGSTVSQNFTATNNTNGSQGGINLGAAAAAAASPNGLVYALLEHNVTATIQALQTEGKLDVLSRPYILTSDNQEASIFVGEIDPYVSDTRVETTGQLVNTVDYRQVGVILDVTPHVNPNGIVVMDINPQVSQRQPGGVTITQGVISPIYSTRTASAHVAIADGATIVIGGMMQDQVAETLNKVPLLGDIPILGPLLFQNKSTQKTKTELLFFLTPHVAEMPERLARISADERKSAVLTTQAVGPGVFDEHMRAMERGGPTVTQPSDTGTPIRSIPLSEPDELPPVVVPPQTQNGE